MINSIFSSCNQILQGFKRQAYQAPDSITTFAVRTIATAALAAIGSRCLSLFCNVGKNNYFIPVVSVGAGAVAAALRLSPWKITATTLGTYGGCKLANYLSPEHDFARTVVRGDDLQKIDTSLRELRWNHPNKKYVYLKLLKDRTIREALTYQKFSVDQNYISNLCTRQIFPQKKLSVTLCKGGFVYPSSDQYSMHWTANFADPDLFGFCLGPLFAQDEIQVAEHPALAQFKSSFGQSARLDGNQIALFANVERLGAIDSSTIYGNAFQTATFDTLDKVVQRLDPPTLSNIFAFAAPRAGVEGQLYSRDNLEKLFIRAYLAFKSIKENHGGNKTIVIHTGNWGAGAFGNCAKTVALLQLAAANLAGVDKLIYYSMDSAVAFTNGSQLLDQLAKNCPTFTVDQFLNHLADNAAQYNLRYGRGNGT